LLATLYNNVMHHNPAFQMDGVGEDLFVLSNGHISPVWYATLARTGYFPVPELATFRKLNTRLQGHPTTHEGLPGVRIASGSLGQGLSVAAGAALAKRLNGDTRRVYCLMGDGELNEGQVWEAAMFTAHHKIDSVIGIVDYNGKQIDGNTSDVMDMGSLPAKWTAFGWDVVELNEGNDVVAIEAALNEAIARSGKGKPVVIIMKTFMGKGVDFMEDDYKWHGVAPTTEQLERALAQLPETLGDY
jgi:transketolase